MKYPSYIQHESKSRVARDFIFLFTFHMKHGGGYKEKERILSIFFGLTGKMKMFLVFPSQDYSRKLCVNAKSIWSAVIS